MLGTFLAPECHRVGVVQCVASSAELLSLRIMHWSLFTSFIAWQLIYF
jgi:hypothetical protein